MRQPKEYENCRVRLKIDADRFPDFIAPAGLEGTVMEARDDFVWVQTDKPFDGAGKSKFHYIQFSDQHVFGSGQSFVEYLDQELEVIGKVDTLPPIVPTSCTGDVLTVEEAGTKKTAKLVKTLDPHGAIGIYEVEQDEVKGIFELRETVCGTSKLTENVPTLTLTLAEMISLGEWINKNIIGKV